MPNALAHARRLLAAVRAAEETIQPGHALRPHHGEDQVEFADDAAALAWLRENRHHITTTIDEMGEADDTEHAEACWQLADAAWPLWRTDSLYDAAARAHQIGLDAAVRCGDVPAQARMSTSGGLMMLDVNPEVAEEWFARARALFAQAGDPLGAARAHHYTALAHVAQGRDEQAAELLEQARAACAAAGDPRTAALGLVELAKLAGRQGNHPRAFHQAMDAVRVLDAHGDRLNTAIAHAVAGRAASALGDRGVAQTELTTAHTALVDLGAAREAADVAADLEQVPDRAPR